MNLQSTLDRVFPFARHIDVTHPLGADGVFMVEMVLPAKRGESAVQIYRFPGGTRPLLDDLLRWDGAHQRISTGHGRWSFFIAWDGVASTEEVTELVARRVIKHPALGDPGHDGYGGPNN